MTERKESLFKAKMREIIKIVILSVLAFVMLAMYTAFAMEFRYFPEFSIFLILLIIALQNRKVIEDLEAENEE